MKKQLIVIGLAALAVSAFAASNAAVQADVVVYGSTPAAISAAIQAKRMGRSVVMVSPETRIGGLTTGGLGQTDIGNKAAFGGIALEFYKAVGKYYGEKADKWRFEPSAALSILENWEKREGLDIRRNEWLNREHGVERADGRVVSIKTLSGKTYRGKVFIDATYEGDLMAAAGVSYHVGREANAVYGETLNGNQPGMAIHHQLSPGVDPFVVPGDPKSGLLRGVESYDPNLKPGDGDTRVQAYCFRMCLTDDPDNKIPFAKPDGYDERDYELMFRHYEAVPPGKVKKLAPPWINSKMPNRKTDTNNKRGFSTDFIGQSWRWAEGTYEEREQILAAHLKYQKGLMWTLANHPRVPEVIRRKVSCWGMCKDEFLDGFGGGWQKQLYVREARRMVGEYVMTEHNCRGKAVAARPIAMGAYAMDSHHVRRYVGADGFVHNEGDVEVSRDEKGNRYPPYSIDYGAIVPKRGECANLLVPVCVSASHIAFGSIRMEPVFFALGQAAGTAAAIACAKSVAVQDVPYAELRERLLADGQVVELSAPSAATGAKGFAPPSLDEIAARLKPLRTWALPYAAGVPYESYVSRKKAPKDLDKLDPEKVRKAAQPWTRLSADAFFPYIDKYGQFVHKDWPDKVHSDADFARQREKEAGDLAAHPGPKGWDKWGGWADGPRFKKTGGFSTTKWNGKWWIVDPDGHLWWSHGPVRVLPSSAMTPLATPAGDRTGWFQELPAKDDPVFGAFYETRDVLLWPYYGKRGIDKVYDFSAANLRRKYGEKWFDTWADLAHRRLRSWGCNTIANSSDKRICLMDRTPYTERFEIHSRPIAGHKGGWWEFCDPFDPSFRAEARRMTEVYREEIADPWCMGFFVDNEHNWGKPHSFALSTLKSPADQPCKAVFRDRLMAKYGTVEKLNAAWGTAYADWDAFMSETNGLKNLKGAKGDLEAFSAEIADNYFRIIREELKRANPGKLYLGCRWAQTAQDFVVRAAAKYCDIISYNIYSKNLRSFKLPDGVDVPVLIGEFHFGALDRGPFCPGLILLKDQKERAATYEDYVLSALEHPQFVGVHWHQFSDQATSGRFDGENMQVGWTDVCDTPYWETVEAVRDIGSRMYAIRANSAHAAQEGLRNPIASFSAPDPFVVWDDAMQYYYHLHTEHAKLEIYRAKHIADILTAEHKTLYVTNAADCVYGDIWAPEMHRAPNGKWYIYTSGRYLPEPRAEKRLIILESNTSDPFDGFVFKGMPTPDTFSIDPTVTTWTDGRQYICYSEVTGRGKQVLVIREMVNPWTFGERKAEIAHAELPWECVDKLINEGAFFVRSPDGKRLFIVYSGNGCWHDDYALGILEFTGGEGGDLCDAKNWKKHPEPILVKGNGVFGPGHASFFRSPDGTELWCAYHALAKSNPSNRGAKRLLNVQKVSFDETGFPVMGKAIGATAQRPPSGE